MMTSLKIKNIISNRKLVLSLFVVTFAIAIACIVAATFASPSVSFGAETPNGAVPSSQNFTADEDEPDPYYIPFTFWQKVNTPSGVEADQQTYTYRLFSIDGSEIPMPGPQGEATKGKEYIFNMTGNETVTFYIDFEAFKPELGTDGSTINTFKYRSEMISPEPRDYYTYESDVTFDVWCDVYNVDWAKRWDKQTIEIICYNPQTGEKVYDPGWNINYDPPAPGVTTPQTIDPNWVIAIVAASIVAACVILILIDKHNKKKSLPSA